MSVKDEIKKMIRDELKGGIITYDKLVSTKPKSSYNKSVKNALALVAIDPEKIVPFGSFSYKAQPYPGDIDAFELIENCCTNEDVYKKAIPAIKKLINKFRNIQDVYIGEMKMGLDKVYKIDIGNINNGLIAGYNYQKVRNDLKKLYDDKYLTKSEYDENIKLVKSDITRLDYEILAEFLRNKLVVRWSQKELEQGYKILPGNRKFTIEDGIRIKDKDNFIKIDIWYLINGRYVEVTNFIMLLQLDKTGNITDTLNSEHVTNFMPSIKKEIEKFAYSPLFFKPFKLAKRMWSIARLLEDKQNVEKLTPLIQSEASLLYQINSEIGTLILMLERIPKPPIKLMLNQIDNFKSRLSNIIDIDFDEEMIDKKIDKMIKDGNKSNLIKGLEKLEEYFKPIINEFTMNYLKGNGLYPVPLQYLPDKDSVSNDFEINQIGEQIIKKQSSKYYIDEDLLNKYINEIKKINNILV